MDTLQNQINQNVCQRFSAELEKTLYRLGQRSGFLATFPVFAFRLLEHRRQSRKTLEIIRAALELCNMNCNRPSCLEAIYEDVRIVRDNYIRMLDTVSETPVLSYLKSWIEDSLDDWDDLAEDCVIASDDEFRGLVMQIAEKV